MSALPLVAAPANSISGAAHGLVTILNPFSGGAGALAGLGLQAVAGWVLSGVKAGLLETAHAIGVTTAPDLTSAWFSATYWRVAALASLLTVPFLCAAAVQALIRSDLALVTQAALVHLPSALLGVSVAAPVVMLLLSATDQLCAAVAGAGTGGGANFLVQSAAVAGDISTIDGSPFLAVVVGMFTAAAALALTIELLIREAAVYVVMLMLPLVFAGLVWPARRIWAKRLLELLVGLILSKFVIVAVLSLAGAAFGTGSSRPESRLLTTLALVLLSTFAPWALLKLLPFAELGASVAGELSSSARRYVDPAQALLSAADPALEWAAGLPGRLLRDADAADSASGASRTSRTSGLHEAHDPGTDSAGGGGPTAAGGGGEGGTASEDAADAAGRAQPGAGEGAAGEAEQADDEGPRVSLGPSRDLPAESEAEARDGSGEQP
jgi:hypothetical protein